MCQLFLVFLLSFAHAESRRIAFTFDDAPNADTFLTGPSRAARLIDGLRGGGVPRVAFFANSHRLDEEGLARLRRYAGAGHVIGNHTHSHPELNAVSPLDFMANVREADRLLSALPGFTRWFRFPYLREGPSTFKRDHVRQGLKDLGYLNAYVTVNTYDWYLNELFQRALNVGDQLDRFRRTYLATTLDAAAYYDRLAHATLGRSPAHVLLLHENDLNAFYVMELAHAFRTAGWTLITPEEAYADEIARHETPDPLASNPGRIGELALEQGVDAHPWHYSCDKLFLETSVGY